MFLSGLAADATEGLGCAAMAIIQLFQFIYSDPVSGQRVTSTHKAQRAEIVERHPDAEVLESTLELRQVPDEPHPDRLQPLTKPTPK